MPGQSPQSPRRPAYRVPRPVPTAAEARAAWVEPTAAAAAATSALDAAASRRRAVYAEFWAVRHALQTGRLLPYDETVTEADGTAATAHYRVSFVGDPEGPPHRESFPVEVVLVAAPWRYGHADRKLRVPADSPLWAHLLSLARQVPY